MKLLQAEGINKSYGTQKVLKNLNLTLDEGKIYGLIGRNGTGKTTLLGVLTGQNRLDSGTVTYLGQPVWENRKSLEHICFSRELSNSVISGQNAFTVQYYLDTAAIFYKDWDKAYAKRLLTLFDLNPKKKITQLSKGQSSLVTIVIALCSRCALTILDEPVAGLDVVAREQFYKLLLEDFSQTNRTFVISTHIIEEAAAVFEEVIFLNNGKIVEQSPTEDLVSQFHYISGHETVVEEACRGLHVLSTEQVGRQMVCAVRGDENKITAISHLDVDVSPMNLQRVFVELCGK